MTLTDQPIDFDPACEVCGNINIGMMKHVKAIVCAKCASEIASEIADTFARDMAERGTWDGPEAAAAAAVRKLKGDEVAA